MSDEKSAPGLSSSADNLTDLAGGAVVNFVGKLGRLTKTTFIAVIKLLFGLEIVGLYETARGITFALSKGGMYGLHHGVVREVVEARASGDDAAAERSIGAALGLGLVLSLVVTIVVAPTDTLIVDKFYPQYPTMVPAIQIMVWAIPLLTLTGIFIAAIAAGRRGVEQNAAGFRPSPHSHLRFSARNDGEAGQRQCNQRGVESSSHLSIAPLS